MKIILPGDAVIDLGEGNEADFADVLIHTTSIVVVGFGVGEDGEKYALGKIANVNLDGIKVNHFIGEELDRINALLNNAVEDEDES